jgi:lipopolysaccharide export system protein LptA
MKLPKPNSLLARAGAAFLALAAMAWSGPASAQGAAAGFDLESSDEPVHIEADVLEVFDDKGTAVFSGNVVATQGDTSLNTVKLTVHYAGGAMSRQANDSTSAESADEEPQQSQSQRIKRLEAEGEVVVTTKEQRATGDKAVFRMEEKTVTLTGDVVLSQGTNVLRGTELVVDLDTGRSRLVSNTESGKPSRVSGMFTPGSAPRPGGDQASQ